MINRTESQQLARELHNQRLRLAAKPLAKTSRHTRLDHQGVVDACGRRTSHAS